MAGLGKDENERGEKRSSSAIMIECRYSRFPFLPRPCLLHLPIELALQTSKAIKAIKACLALAKEEVDPTQPMPSIFLYVDSPSIVMGTAQVGGTKIDRVVQAIELYEAGLSQGK